MSLVAAVVATAVNEADLYIVLVAIFCLPVEGFLVDLRVTLLWS